MEQLHYLQGSPSAGIGVPGKLDLSFARPFTLDLGGKSRRDIILSSALPVLNGGFLFADLREGEIERFSLGESDLDFTTT